MTAKLVVLDSLFDSLELEEETARTRGASLERWSGDPAALADADAVVHVRTPVDADLLAAMPRCRVVARFGTGLDTVDVAAAERAGVAVVAVRDYCIPELTAHSLGLAFALARRLGEIGGALDDDWRRVAERTPLARYDAATVVGLGAIGRRVAAALAALGLAVRVVTRRPAEAKRLGLEHASLEDGLAGARLVFLHAALDGETRGMIDRERLALLDPAAILVDTARLDLLDERAVADALDAGRLGGLGLDARLAPESPLRRFAGDPRVLITPHVGWYSDESAAALRRAAVAGALDALEGR